MRLSQLVAASNAAGAVQQAARKHSILLYGKPKTGKTELAGTLAKLEAANNIYWFDLENGSDTLADMVRRGKLTPEQADKIVLIKVPDLRDTPVAMETLLKSICTKAAVKICEEHGRVNCPDCTKAGKEFVQFDHKSLGPNDWIVIDSLSQAGVSAMNMACLGKDAGYKPTFDEYGLQGKWLSDLLTTVQAAPYCNFLCITHVQLLEEDDGKEVYAPLCGTKNFSSGCAKYFGTVIFVEMKMKQHKAGSSTSYNAQTQAGSRIGLLLEKEKDLDLSIVLPAAGICVPTTGETPKAEAVIAESKPSFLKK